jgi:hypothetical protein
MKQEKCYHQTDCIILQFSCVLGQGVADIHVDPSLKQYDI